MTMAEWFCEFYWRRPKDPENDYAGNLTQADIEKLQELVNASTD